MQTVEMSAFNQNNNGISPDDDILLTSRQVRAQVGNVTEMCIWRWIRDDRVRFPEPLKINGRNYWTKQQLREWMAQRFTKVAAETAI